MTVLEEARDETPPWVGRPVPRKEDAALLTGRARFIDDLAPLPGLAHAAILRSPYPHAEIRGIDAARALALPGVLGVVTGAEIAEMTETVPSVVRTAPPYRPIAVDKARYVGEPVAVVVAEDRYLAEDALDRIEVDYAPLLAVTDVVAALAPDAPVLHEALEGNLAQRRDFTYGDPDAAFARADRTFRLDYTFPRSSATPMETFGVVAHFEEAPARYTVWSNFQGPFVLHPLMARALRVPGNRLRLITPPASGGSFGIKQAVFAYIILLGAVSRKLGQPVKWIEDRLEHLMGASAAGARAGTVEAAFTDEGRLLGLRYDNVANMGAWLRAPEPASVYRMHATAGGGYDVRDIAISNRLVLTNTVPIGLNRGYGGPQFYFALERIMEVAARGLGLDPGELRRHNFVAADAFPYECAGGSKLDAGDYHAALDEAKRLIDYEALRVRREAARAEGRRFGIGFAVGVEPSGSNMAYVSLAQPAEERARSDQKSGAAASVIITIDPSGRATVQLCSTPNGQGHATVAAQIVADTLGLEPDDVDVVTDIDTQRSPWSIASGNYSNRFAAIVTGAIQLCGERAADKVRRLAADVLEAAPEDIELAGGRVRIAGVPDKGLPLARVASRAHWDASTLPDDVTPGFHETVLLSPDVLGPPSDDDRIASSVTYGFVADIVGVEVDATTGRLRVDSYVSVHDVGPRMNPAIVEGQVWGGFAHGLGAALMEELAYDEAGNFLAGSFADYLCPTATEIPDLIIGHVETPSPQNPLGAKGMGDGSSMLTPAAIANAVADALDRDDVAPPFRPMTLWALANGREVRPPASVVRDDGIPSGPDVLSGEGEVVLPRPPDAVWRMLIDTEALARLVPGCERLEETAPGRYRGEVSIGVAGIRGRYVAEIEHTSREAPHRLVLRGQARGALGHGGGGGEVRLEPMGEDETRLSYRYGARVGGKVASVGQRMLGTVTETLIGQFFQAFAAELADEGGEATSFWHRLFGRGGRS